MAKKSFGLVSAPCRAEEFGHFWKQGTLLTRSGFGSGFLIPDLDPDQKLAKTSFLVLKFLRSLTFKKAAFPQLRFLATNEVRNKFAGSGSDPLVRGTDPYQSGTGAYCVYT